jgi:creatinine amidohydrolase/Fe(II)-dependent formamide hydrolase-like protein
MFLLKSGSFLFILFVIVIFQPFTAAGQIYHVAEMNTKQIQSLNKQKTVVILTGGVLEQHGPFMPSFSDGYMNERLSRDLADAVVARPGWSVLMFPTIPLGTGGANEIGYKNIFPGSYGVRASTLRTIFMDLATQLGDQGFRWAFVVHGHGSPLHNQALDRAGDYFRDTFGGRMVNLTGLLPKPSANLPPFPILTDKEREENGLDIHAGMSELSRILYIRPDLVDASYKTARPFSADSMESLVQIAKADSWLGYFGSPRLATASRGAQIYRRQSAQMIDTALKILDGLDERTVPRFADESLSDPGEFAISLGSIKRDEEIEKRQREWLRKKKLQ